MEHRSLLHRATYREFHTIEERDGAGRTIRPARTYYQKRVRWVGPIQGWRENELLSALAGQRIWHWGPMICNELGVYVTVLHVLYWGSRRLWCNVCYGGHDFGGMFDSCSRCGHA